MVDLMEMDEMHEDGLLDDHGTNLGLLKTKLAKAMAEFTIHRWEQAVEGITSLESSARLTDPGGASAPKQSKLSSREKLLAKATSSSRVALPLPPRPRRPGARRRALLTCGCRLPRVRTPISASRRS
jgi:hypothetical protein